jgi:hypothetical protein
VKIHKAFFVSAVTVSVLLFILSLALPRSGTDAMAAVSIGAMFVP